MKKNIKTYFQNISWGYLFLAVNSILFIQVLLGMGIGLLDVIFWTIMMQVMLPQKNEQYKIRHGGENAKKIFR